MEVGNLGKPYSLLNLAYVGIMRIFTLAATLRRSGKTRQRRIRPSSAPAQKGHPDGWPSA